MTREENLTLPVNLTIAKFLVRTAREKCKPTARTRPWGEIAVQEYLLYSLLAEYNMP